MIKRTLYFGNPSVLRLKDLQLNIESTVDGKAKKASVPVEDLGLIIIDHPQITLSSGLIQALQENKVALVSCDYRHMPQSVLLPLEGNSVQQERYEVQLSASEPLKKQLWQQTVTQKIKNQYRNLCASRTPADYLIPSRN